MVSTPNHDRKKTDRLFHTTYETNNQYKIIHLDKHCDPRVNDEWFETMKRYLNWDNDKITTELEGKFLD